MTTYLEAAKACNRSLLFHWSNMAPFTDREVPAADFWMTGNIFQTFLDYWVRCKQPADADICRQILERFYRIIPQNMRSDDFDNLFHRSLDQGRYWFDDFGWWGNAFMTACENAEALGLNEEEVKSFLKPAISCWTLMHRAWDDPLSPVQPGGIWNTRAAAEKGSPDLHGRNNVTNTQFWMLSYRLAQMTHDNTEYLSRWKDIRKRFETLNDAGLLLSGPDTYFVRERFKGEKGEKWTDGFYWAGDQGLFLHCMELDNRSTPPFSNLKTKVLDYVLNNMFDQDGVLHDQRIVTTNNFNEDYATGKGVFFKNIYPTALASPSVKLFDNIMASATHAWATKTLVENSVWSYDFKFGWNDKGKLPIPGNWDTQDNGINSDFRRLVLHISVMDVMNTAAALNPSGVISEMAVKA